MKVDKEAILKQKFWILLGVFALLWLICLSVLYANASGPADEAKKNYDTAKTAVSKYTGANKPKNDSFLPPWQKDIDLFEQHKKTVWKSAWEGDAGRRGARPAALGGPERHVHLAVVRGVPP